MSRRDYRKGALPFEFIPVPKLIVNGEKWQALSFSARALAMDLAAQYTGKNNGRLTPAWEAMQRCGWTSKSTLVRAKAALLEASFVILTRKGHAPRTAEWIGFTWWQLNWHETMEIGPRGYPYLNFQTLEAARIDPNVGRDQASNKRVVRSRNETDDPGLGAPGGLISIPMNGANHAPSVSIQNLVS